jgi:hypothetical protein
VTTRLDIRLLDGIRYVRYFDVRVTEIAVYSRGFHNLKHEILVSVLDASEEPIVTDFSSK